MDSPTSSTTGNVACTRSPAAPSRWQSASQQRPPGQRKKPRAESGGQASSPVSDNALLLGERVGEPVEALVEAVAGRRARRLDVPVALAERVQAELVGDLRRVHRVGQVLLVGEDE